MLRLEPRRPPRLRAGRRDGLRRDGNAGAAIRLRRPPEPGGGGMGVARTACPPPPNGPSAPSSGLTYYYHGDALGSTRKRTWHHPSVAVTFSAEYEPFGRAYTVQGSEAYKYTGEKHDDPTGLVYLRARQYDPDLGRFVSADPVLGALGMPQTLNRYAYVVNNPLKYTDPTGEFWFKNQIGDWWGSLGPNPPGLIMLGAAVALVLATGGIGGLVIASHAVVGTAMVTFAAGAAMGAIGYVAVDSIFFGGLSLERIGSAALFGAVLGGISAIAPMAAGSIAGRLGYSATGFVAQFLRLGVVGGSGAAR